jgi:hypothetical protein
MAAGPPSEGQEQSLGIADDCWGVGITVRKVAAGLGTVAAAGLLWFASASVVLVGTFVAAAAAFLTSIYLVRSRRRRAVVRSVGPGPAWVASTSELGDIVADLELNGRLVERFGHTAGRDGPSRSCGPPCCPGKERNCSTGST